QEWGRPREARRRSPPYPRFPRRISILRGNHPSVTTLGVARQVVLDVQPRLLCRGVDVVLRRHLLGVVEGREANVDLLRVLGLAPGDLRAAFRAEMAEGPGRGAIGGERPGRHLEPVRRDRGPGDDGRPTRLLAHPAMAVAGTRDSARPIAHRAAQTATGHFFGHDRLLQSYICSSYSAGSMTASMIVKRRAATAARNPAAKSSIVSTRNAAAPKASPTRSKRGGRKSTARGASCIFACLSLMRLSAPSSRTTTMIGRSYSAATASSPAVIRRQPSPTRARTGRDRSMS